MVVDIIKDKNYMEEVYYVLLKFKNIDSISNY